MFYGKGFKEEVDNERVATQKAAPHLSETLDSAGITKLIQTKLGDAQLFKDHRRVRQLAKLHVLDWWQMDNTGSESVPYSFALTKIFEFYRDLVKLDSNLLVVSTTMAVSHMEHIAAFSAMYGYLMVAQDSGEYDWAVLDALADLHGHKSFLSMLQYVKNEIESSLKNWDYSVLG